jgi:L-iditol 2-dehydrogenase
MKCLKLSTLRGSKTKGDLNACRAQFTKADKTFQIESCCWQGGNMKAAVLEKTQMILVKDAPPPEPSTEEVLVHVSLAGICGSDHTLFQGRFGVPLPVIPGHEAIGTIVKLGDRVTGLSVGQRVTIQPNFSCGHCPLCVSGSGNLCSSKTRLGVDINGVFAEFVKVPARYIWPIPEGIDDQVAVFTEPLAVGIRAMKKAAPLAADKVLIFGAGVMGLLTLQLAALKGACINALDLSTTRLALARKLGAAQTIDPEQPIESHFNTFDLIYETSGAPGALDLSIRLAAPKGKIVVLGLPGREHSISTDLVVRKELQILGSLIYTDEFPKSLETLKSGQIQTELLTSAKIGLSDLHQALTDFNAPGRIKTLVKI